MREMFSAHAVTYVSQFIGRYQRNECVEIHETYLGRFPLPNTIPIKEQMDSFRSCFWVELGYEFNVGRCALGVSAYEVMVISHARFYKNENPMGPTATRRFATVALTYRLSYASPNILGIHCRRGLLSSAHLPVD